MKKHKGFLIFLVLLLCAMPLAGAWAEESQTATPAAWREAIADAMEEMGVPLETPFSLNEDFGEDRIGGWPYLLYDATAHDAWVYFDQFLLDEDTVNRYFACLLLYNGNVPEDAYDEAYDLFAEVAVRCMLAADASWTEEEARATLADLSERERTDPPKKPGDIRVIRNGLLYHVGLWQGDRMFRLAIESVE